MYVDEYMYVRLNLDDFRTPKFCSLAEACPQNFCSWYIYWVLEDSAETSGMHRLGYFRGVNAQFEVFKCRFQAFELLI